MLLGALLIAALLSGCYHEQRGAPDTFRLDGTLAANLTADDRADLERRAGQRDAQVTYLESSPERFDIRPLLESECDNLRIELQAVDYVQEVGECHVLPRFPTPAAA